MQLLTRFAVLPALVALALSLSGCRAVEAVFKAGVWVAVIGMAIVAFLVFSLFRMVRR